jgi:hypothetical protein
MYICQLYDDLDNSSEPTNFKRNQLMMIRYNKFSIYICQLGVTRKAEDVAIGLGPGEAMCEHSIYESN